MDLVEGIAASFTLVDAAPSLRRRTRCGGRERQLRGDDAVRVSSDNEETPVGGNRGSPPLNPLYICANRELAVTRLGRGPSPLRACDCGNQCNGGAAAISQFMQFAPTNRRAAPATLHLIAAPALAQHFGQYCDRSWRCEYRPHPEEKFFGVALPPSR